MAGILNGIFWNSLKAVRCEIKPNVNKAPIEQLLNMNYLQNAHTLRKPISSVLNFKIITLQLYSFFQVMFQ